MCLEGHPAVKMTLQYSPTWHNIVQHGIHVYCRLLLLITSKKHKIFMPLLASSNANHTHSLRLVRRKTSEKRERMRRFFEEVVYCILSNTDLQISFRENIFWPVAYPDFYFGGNSTFVTGSISRISWG